MHVPGMGVVLTFVVVLGTGLVAANILGQRLLRFWESVLGRIPVVKSIYNSVKQVSDTLFSSSGQAFRKALLVQYPREGSWTIAFLTGQPGGDVANHFARRIRERLRADHAEPDVGIFSDDAESRRDRARHERR